MKTFYILIFTALFQVGFGQGYHPPIKNFTPRDYGVSQPPENYSITVDDRGFIYVANVGAVLEYDGFNWEGIEVETGKALSSIKYVGSNTIAVGGLNLIGLIQPDKKGQLKFKSLLTLLPKEMKEIGDVITIEHIQDKIIFQTENHLIIYEKGKLKLLKPSSTFFRGVSANKRYFVRERGVGLMELVSNQLQLFSSDSISKDIGYFGLVDYDKDYFLAATYDFGFYLMNKKTGQLTPFASEFVSLYWPGIFGLEKLKNGDFVVATVNYGIAILDEDLYLKHLIGKREGLRSSKINQLVIDKFENVWAATNEGVSWLDIYSPLHYFNEQAGISGNVEAIVKLGSVYYGGTSTGLYSMISLEDSNQPWHKIPDFNSAVYSLDQNGKDILVATSSGLFRGTLNSFWKMNDGNYHSVKYIPQRKKIVAVTSNKIEIYDESYNLIEPIQLPNHFTRILNIAYDTSFTDFTRVWIGLAQGQGVIKLDIYDLARSKFEIYDDMDGLMKGEIHPVSTSHGVLFLTNNGIQRFIPEEEIKKTLSDEQKDDPSFYRGYFDVFQLGNKSVKGTVSSMVMANNRIYICVNDKLGFYNQKIDFITQEFSNLNIGRINSLYVDGDDIWISGAEGVVRYHPQHGKNINESFQLFVRKISLKNDELFNSGFFQTENKWSFHQGKTPFVFDYSNNSFTIQFATNYFNPIEKMKFSYFLEGHDEDWSSWTDENKVKLNNLLEGDYVLHIKAKNSYGVESEESIIYFTVSPPWYRTTFAYIAYIIIAIFIIFLSIRIASYRLKQSNIRLENTVKERTVEIANKNDELEYQNHQILHQKQEITDSINYAKRIQEAILPLMENVKAVFPDSFILFKPKDIVSGDFYWFAHQDNKSIFVCADCTGHGVPGAFMSMICTDRINHTVLEKKISTPSAMLSEVNRGIKRSLKQEDETSLKTKDGMDAAFCTYDHTTKILKYAGANRPLWLLRNTEIIEYKPTKMAVGGFTPEEQIFDEIEIQIEKGDIVYMSTDGYADQFGGPKGKKLMVKAFKEFLIQNSQLPFEEQRILLDKNIEDWRNTAQTDGEEIEQVDDMCVVGIRF